MKTLSAPGLLVVSLLFSALLGAQPFPGLSFDNYAGVHGLLLNPANAAANNVGFELHLGSVNAGLANDYIGLPSYSDLLDEEDIYAADLTRTPAADNFRSSHLNVLGPSLLMGLGQSAGLGLVTRVRNFYEVRNLDGRLTEGQDDGFGRLDDFSGTYQDFNTNSHGWAEVAVVLGAVLVNRKEFQLKGGAAVKVLRGLGGYHAGSPSLEVAYDGGSGELITGGEVADVLAGDYSYGELDLDALSEKLGTGVGFDLGLSLEWRPGGVPADRLRTPYRLKVGASVVDLGAVTYEEARVSTYPVGGRVSTDLLEGRSLAYVLEDNYDGTSRREAADFRLPTALYLHLDYRLAGGLFLSALSASALNADPLLAGNRITNAITVAPRLETKWLSLYAPARFGGPEGTSLGAGLRLGFVTIGSATLLSHLFTDTNYAADVYAGVKIPFYRRLRAKEVKEIVE
ncbi:DUF5723 family protein [Neolewinella litorea]|uniref:DUF5723 domain-containing protein n=1 Tax=Neolewinella litorea TaxID=2562452 RepID=A0A4S4NV21_9BACT|nr:DUF5723 family protein [Neolewinella litorea]THH40080.1 hypothetical protein E4021_10800 [Neolewinella litorea]